MQNKQNFKILKDLLLLALQVGFIFAIPAVLLGIFGSYLDNKYNTDPMWTSLLLLVAFVISWFIVIRMYKG